MDISKSPMIYYPSFGDLNKFKVSLLYEEATEIESIDFVGLCNSTKGLHLCCHKYQSRNLSTYLNTTRKASFFKGSLKIWCNYRNDNLENLEG